MRTISILLTAPMLFFLSCSGLQETTQTTKYTIEQFYKNTNIGGGSFSPDESKLLVSSNETGIYNVYEIELATGNRKALTNSTEESFLARSYLPNDDRFIFTFDEGGNEQYQIHLSGGEGTSRNLTPGDSIRNQFWGWSRDEESMFYSSNRRDPRFMDIYELAISQFDEENPIGEIIYQNNDGIDVSEISPDKNYFVFVQAITTSANKMYLYNRATGERTDISGEGASYNPQFFSLDNQYLYYTTDENANFSYLARRELASGNVEKVHEADWDVMYAYDSWNEKYRVIGINEDAKTKVRVYDLETGDEVQMPDMGSASVSSVGISKSEQLARLTVSSSASPTNMYLYNFETGDLKQLTNTLNEEINGDDLVEGRVVRFESFDGVEIPAIYYEPKGASTENPVPALVRVHGGPGGQSRLSYNALNQYLLNHGYAILAVNNRGSSGYGKEFYEMDDLNHGDKDLKDCIAGKDFLASTGVIDMDKVGILGGSYGGYMVMAALAFEPEAFDVGVNIFGVTNWIRTLRSIPPHWESFKDALFKELGDPYSADSARLYNISPLFHAQNVTKPLMVLQGANDIRVLQVESDEIVEGVRANGVPVEYVIFDDEGHGFRKKENEINGYGQIKDFLDKHLKGGGELAASL